MRRLSMILLLTSLVVFPLQAATVLYYADQYEGTNFVTPALSAGGHTVTTATGWSDFNTKLNAGGYDLVIALAQNNATQVNATYLQNYIDGGGRVIFADYAQTSGYGTALQFSYTGNTNQTQMTVSESSLLTGGVSNPITLTNPGWGTFSMGLDTGGSLATFGNGDDAIASGNSGRTLVLGFLADTLPASDGQQFWENMINYVLGQAAVAVEPVPALDARGLVMLAAVLAAAAALVLRRI